MMMMITGVQTCTAAMQALLPLPVHATAARVQQYALHHAKQHNCTLLAVCRAAGPTCVICCARFM
jgi:hypothetical protein